MIVYIPLSRKYIALVSECDETRLRAHKWHASGYGRRIYAIRRVRDPETGKSQTIRMHREIMHASPGYMVDHINHDTLDNRRENLRLCTNTENACNRRKTRGTSQYKGVYRSCIYSCWEASIQVNGRSIYLGRFTDERDAARAYNVAALKYHGTFACLNDIEEP